MALHRLVNLGHSETNTIPYISKEKMKTYMIKTFM